MGILDWTCGKPNVLNLQSLAMTAFTYKHGEIFAWFMKLGLPRDNRSRQTLRFPQLIARNTPQNQRGEQPPIEQCSFNPSSLIYTAWLRGFLQSIMIITIPNVLFVEPLKDTSSNRGFF